MEFRIRLTELLEEKKMKQADLCRATGISTSLISQYSSGKATPLLDNAKSIARALGVSLDELVGWHPKEELPLRSIDCTEDEAEMIRRYRVIDERGQRTVRRLLDAEYEDAMANHSD